MYARGKLTTVLDKAVSSGMLQTRIFAEIKTYLTILKAEGVSGVLAEIQEFTRSFAGYNTFTIDAYLLKFKGVKPGATLTGDFSIALPPGAVVDYLKRICERPTAAGIDATPPKDQVVLGMGVAGDTGKFKGLEHWVYRESGDTIYNWGAKASLRQYKSSSAHIEICQIVL